MLDLAGKVAAVTGAGSGIGRGVALALARAGADVVCSDAVAQRAEETAELVRGLGRKAVANVADVRSKEQLEAMVAAAVSELGGLHIAVANAGIGRAGSVLTMTEEDWDTQVDVNLKGVYLTVQACARAMVRQERGGRVITIASLAAERAAPGMFAYCASKAGVRMMTRCWALDLAPFGITVNSIGPGIIDTPLGSGLLGEGDARALNERAVPAGRAGLPGDIGNLACWLASDEAEYVTGTYNLIDGGLADGAGFGLTPDPSLPNPIQGLRDARRSMSGEQVLAMLDGMSQQMRAEGDRLRGERGLL